MAEYDFIVIGGGSAGSAVAGRLSEDPRRKVCVLEAGGTNDNVIIKTPGFMPFIRNASNYKFDTVPQAGLNGRIGYQPRGRGLGGSSAINAMVYIRGNAWDYDNWAAQGCNGWAYEDVLPYFMKSESNERGENAWHGSDGPLSVSNQRTPNQGSIDFVESAAALQLPRNDDFNGQEQAGFGLYQVTQKDGERWSAARAYLTPKPNLDIRTGVVVERILIEEGRAVGVSILRGRKREEIRAAGGVVLSAGAFNSPQILMLSGIGPAAHLREHGIAVVDDRDAVGNNLQDHLDYVSSWKTRSKEFIGTSFTGYWRMAKAALEHRRHRTGIMTTCYAEAGGFWRVDPEAPAPDIQWHFVPAMLEDHGRSNVWGHGFSLHACLLRPYSKGTVRLADATPGSAPAIDPKFLSDERDLPILRKGVRLSHRIAAAPPLSDYAGEDRHPIDLDDDTALNALIRQRADTVYHPVGTCRMGADEASVVDPKLRARSAGNLWIADASIMPELISGNTNAPSMMIGERCADFIKEST